MRRRNVFVPEDSRDQYNPHLRTGIGGIEFLDAMLAEPFETFTFSTVGSSVCHLGNCGTAVAKLHSCRL